MRTKLEPKREEFDQTRKELERKRQEIEALDYLYNEIFCNYDEGEISEVFDGYDE